jgi:hypothetical protein
MAADDDRTLRDWVVALRTAAALTGAIASLLAVYLLTRADTLSEGVSERSAEMREMRLRIELLERQMAAPPSRTGGVTP